MTGDDIFVIASDLGSGAEGVSERARKKYQRNLARVNDERAAQGLLPLDLCSQSYWKHSGWAMKVKGCGARVRRWEFGDYTALDPPDTVLSTTVPVVPDSVQRIYDTRAEEDNFLRSKDLADSRDHHSRMIFRQRIRQANVQRLKHGLLPLDLCSQSFWKNRRWAMKVEECQARIRRWELGDSTALDPPDTALSTTIPVVPDSVQQAYDKRAGKSGASVRQR